MYCTIYGVLYVVLVCAVLAVGALLSVRTPTTRSLVSRSQVSSIENELENERWVNRQLIPPETRAPWADAGLDHWAKLCARAFPHLMRHLYSLTTPQSTVFRL